MRIHPRNVGFVLLVVVFTPIAWISLYAGSNLDGSNYLEKRLAEMRDRLQQVEVLSRERASDIQVLSKQLRLLVRSGTGARNVSLPQETRDLINNMSLGSSDVSLPGIYHYLPHLVSHPGSLSPAFTLSKGRMAVSIVIGVPTIKRPTQSYLMQTLQSLIVSFSDEEKEDCVIVVFIAEPWDIDFVKSTASQIQQLYQSSIDSGLLEVVSPPASFYPDLNSLRETFGDSKERVKWRTKQNLDFSFLMMYGRKKATYYVQLEDDVITVRSALSYMLNFARKNKASWVLLDFCNLGFIGNLDIVTSGKLFKSSDLPMVVEFFLMFHKDKPIDWLLGHLLFVKYCSPEKDNKHCQRQIAEYRIRFKPSLFQHIGVHSSLKGKVQKLKDKDFGKPGNMFRAHVNPRAEVSTTLKNYQRFTLDKAYMGESFFWATLPHAGDYVLFKFSPPIAMDMYRFRSGNPEHPGDTFVNTTVEILPESHIGNKQGGVLDNDAPKHVYPLTDDGYYIVGNFSHVTGLAEGTIDASVGLVNSVRLRLLTASKNWIILNEDSVYSVIHTGRMESPQPSASASDGH